MTERLSSLSDSLVVVVMEMMANSERGKKEHWSGNDWNWLADWLTDNLIDKLDLWKDSFYWLGTKIKLKNWFKKYIFLYVFSYIINLVEISFKNKNKF